MGLGHVIRLRGDTALPFVLSGHGVQGHGGSEAQMSQAGRGRNVHCLGWAVHRTPTGGVLRSRGCSGDRWAQPLLA